MAQSQLEVVLGNVAGDEEVECLGIWLDTTILHFFQDSGDVMAVAVADGLKAVSMRQIAGREEDDGRAKGS